MNTEKRLPRVELELGMHFNECSIAAADANRRVNELLSDNDRTIQRRLYVVDSPDERPAPYDFAVAPLAKDIVLHDGRPVELALIQQKSKRDVSNPQLVAVARGNIAFPIVGFRRREGSFCDYVQLGQEINADDIIATPRDETSRKTLIEDMRIVIDADPLTMIYREVLQYDARDTSEARRLSRLIEYSREYLNMIRPELSKELVYERVILDDYLTDVHERSNLSAGYYEYNQFRANRHQKNAVKLIRDIGQVDLVDIRDGKVPGTKNPLTKKLLLRHALHTRGVDQGSLQQTGGAAKRLLGNLDVASIICESLGPYDANLEKTIKFAGDLAVRNVQLKTVVEDFIFSSTKADTEIIVSAKPNGKVGAFIMSIAARPLGMERSQAVDAGMYVIDRLGLNSLEPEEVQELSNLIDLVSP